MTDSVSNVVISFNYAYNNAGVITNIVREDGSEMFYAYDSLDRLISERKRNASGVAVSGVQYTYDLAGIGQIISQGGDKAGYFNFRFSTKYLDAETGLYYYGLRFSIR